MGWRQGERLISALARQRRCDTNKCPGSRADRSEPAESVAHETPHCRLLVIDVGRRGALDAHGGSETQAPITRARPPHGQTDFRAPRPLGQAAQSARPRLIDLRRPSDTRGQISTDTSPETAATARRRSTLAPRDPGARRR
jgi:hypothetical protein